MKIQFVAATLCFVGAGLACSHAGAWAGASAAAPVAQAPVVSPPEPPLPVAPPAEWGPVDSSKAGLVVQALHDAVTSTQFTGCRFKDGELQLLGQWSVDLGKFIDRAQSGIGALERHQIGDEALHIVAGTPHPDVLPGNTEKGAYGELLVHLTPESPEPQRVVSIDFRYEIWSVKAVTAGSIESPKQVYELVILPNESGSVTCVAKP